MHTLRSLMVPHDVIHETHKTMPALMSYSCENDYFVFRVNFISFGSLFCAPHDIFYMPQNFNVLTISAADMCDRWSATLSCSLLEANTCSYELNHGIMALTMERAFFVQEMTRISWSIEHVNC